MRDVGHEVTAHRLETTHRREIVQSEYRSAVWEWTRRKRQGAVVDADFTGRRDRASQRRRQCLAQHPLAWEIVGREGHRLLEPQ